MSVKISRREEKRDTSLRDFLLAAVLPLLLTGIIGFFIGQAGKVDSRMGNKALEEMTTRAEKSEVALEEYRIMVLAVDSLKNVFQESVEELTSELQKSIEMASAGSDFIIGGPFNNLDRLLAREGDSFSEAIGGIEGRAENRSILQKREIRAIIAPLKSLVETELRRIRDEKNDFNAANMNNEQISQRLTDAEEDKQEAVDEAKHDLKMAQNALDISKQELELCVAQKAALENNETPTFPSYKAEKAVISKAAKDIMGASKEIPGGLLRSGRNKELSKEISEAAEEIMLAVESIGN